MLNGGSYTIFSNNIEDVSGNISSEQFLNYEYLVGETPQSGDLIITEIFADPTPL